MEGKGGAPVFFTSSSSRPETTNSRECEKVAVVVTQPLVQPRVTTGLLLSYCNLWQSLVWGHWSGQSSLCVLIIISLQIIKRKATKFIGLFMRSHGE